MTDQPLFRKEAMQERLHQNLGTITINLPINTRYATVFGSLLILLLLSYILLASTSETIHTRGLLQSVKGTIQINAEKSGVLLKSYVHEGQQVQAGMPLFLIHAGYQKDQEDKTGQLLKERLSTLQEEEQLTLGQLSALEKLYKDHYLSSNEVENKKLALLELDGRIKEARLNLLHHQENKEMLIQAPIHAIVRNIQIQNDQFIKANQMMAELIPYHEPLIVEFYLPATQSGFIKKGDPLKLDFDAYPASRFGFQKARVQSIHHSLLMNTQAEKQLGIHQPSYKIIATLDSEEIKIRGQLKRLQPGMPLSIVLQGEQRALWRWIIQPFFDFYKSL